MYLRSWNEQWDVWFIWLYTKNLLKYDNQCRISIETVNERSVEEWVSTLKKTKSQQQEYRSPIKSPSKQEHWQKRPPHKEGRLKCQKAERDMLQRQKKHNTEKLWQCPCRLRKHHDRDDAEAAFLGSINTLLWRQPLRGTIHDSGLGQHSVPTTNISRRFCTALTFSFLAATSWGVETAPNHHGNFNLQEGTV